MSDVRSQASDFNVNAGGAVATSDNTDSDYIRVSGTVTASGSTVIYTPTSGKRIRIHRFNAFNDPLASASILIQVYLGSVLVHTTWGMAIRQQETSLVTNDTLSLKLSATGNVAYNFRIEEIT